MLLEPYFSEGAAASDYTLPTTSNRESPPVVTTPQISLLWNWYQDGINPLLWHSLFLPHNFISRSQNSPLGGVYAYFNHLRQDPWAPGSLPILNLGKSSSIIIVSWNSRDHLKLWSKVRFLGVKVAAYIENCCKVPLSTSLLWGRIIAWIAIFINSHNSRWNQSSPSILQIPNNSPYFYSDKAPSLNLVLLLLRFTWSSSLLVANQVVNKTFLWWRTCSTLKYQHTHTHTTHYILT